MSELPRGWVEAEVREVVQPTESCDPTKEGDLEFQYVDIGSINNKTFSIENPKTIVGRDAPSRAKRRIRRGDVLFSTVRTYLKNIALVPDELDGEITSTGIAVLRPSQAVLSDFLFALVRSEGFIRPLSLKQDGTLYPAITDSDLLNHTVPLPPLAEQKRIVAKLDALNAKSARARTELARIETLVSRYKQAVLSKAFSGELTREWRYLAGGLAPVRPRQAQQMKPAYRLSLEQSFDAPYDLPTSWEWLTFPSIGDLDRGKSKHRPRNDPRLYDGPFPFIQTGDVRAADQYVREHSQAYSEFGLKQSKLWPPETLCITIAANIAETALLSYPACFPDSVVGFSGDEDKMLPKYAEFFLRTAKERISQFAPATAQKNINLEILAAVRLPVAPLEEQHEIVRRIESAFAKIDRLAKEAKRALGLVGRLDEAILAKAFRGELVPQDEDDEPAEHLLARIRAEREAAPKAKRGRGRAA
ncbi:restriction endonuclease subunit S [Rhizobium sp. CECT 9324]|uniref:restriction endonuclease subunit S n=1 Tax=Rhizobium sp. CECT 9324 TaxID=2845820 RepID=UPI001E3EE715|nr:restriction endonuclease subunit S [Rhizobium sp. CECT 9324]CAH0343029.1 hypothetical protein RHI9324_04762 [Rhizobium sp. CECT 9324]